MVKETASLRVRLFERQREKLAVKKKDGLPPRECPVPLKEGKENVN